MNISSRLSIILIMAATALCSVSCGDSYTPADQTGPESQDQLMPGNTIVIYETNPKIFATSDALKAIENRLDEIRDLGANVIWLMPLQQQGSKKSVGSPYCIRDFKAVNSSYGSIDDLKSLVSKAHSMDMKVIMDWIANHTSWDNVWITEHPEWYTKDAAGNIISPAGTGWNDVADLDFSSTELRTSMIDAMTFWIKEAGIDGFRCDHADGVPTDFWTEALEAIKAIDPDAILLAEGSDPKLLDCGFQILYGWEFQSKLSSTFSGRTKVSSLYEARDNEYKGFAEGKERLRFTTNHDIAMNEASPVTMYKGERGAMSAFVISTFIGGIPLIYSSQEIGYAKTLSFFTTTAINWNSNPSYTEEYREVMAAYHASAPLRGGKPALYDTGYIASIYYKGGLLVVANTSGSDIQVMTPGGHSGKKATDLITGQSESIPSALNLEGYQYKIWKLEQ